MQSAASARTKAADAPAPASAPVGVFDSGVGGLSVLQHIRRQLPHESLLYFADSDFAPYGDRPEAVIVQRSLAIAQFLLTQDIKALVVACNTATAAAIAAIRQAYPALIVVGVEPGLKPAIALSKTGIVGVLATSRTLQSQKFVALRDHLSKEGEVRFLTQACVGLADQIEKGELQSPATALLLHRYIAPLIAGGADTLVLGCTHYPFVRPLIEQVIHQVKQAADVSVIDTGEAVARQLARLLAAKDCLNPTPAIGSLSTYATGSHSSFRNALSKLLQLDNADELVQEVTFA
ncbi:glutamate racemase [Undibacterium sp.]|uniref:glutamate racemase n=1 Tax=Undibacterium sp. TaxID=1914977 RepID=UPI002CA2EE66|nr:glutamate racemase [Undibacterium sp.]HTD04741.1 glutamate racemase [Undibacterium sp.]